MGFRSQAGSVTCLMAPDRVAHFFVPLPEPIGLPDGYEYRVVAHPTGSELRELIEAGHEDPAQGHLETVLTFHHADMPSHLTATHGEPCP